MSPNPSVTEKDTEGLGDQGSGPEFHEKVSRIPRPERVAGAGLML